MKKFISGLFIVVVVMLAGCGANPKAVPDKAQAPEKVSTGVSSVRKTFTVEDVQFSLLIPQYYIVSDYSKEMNGVRIYKPDKRSSLLISVESAANYDVKKMTGKNWMGKGLEILSSTNADDAMLMIRRSFLYPLQGDKTLVLNEVVSETKVDASPDMKALADSLLVL